VCLNEIVNKTLDAAQNTEYQSLVWHGAACLASAFDSKSAFTFNDNNACSNNKHDTDHHNFCRQFIEYEITNQQGKYDGAVLKWCNDGNL